MLLREDLLQVRAPILGGALCFYVLRDSQGLYLIDTGFIGGFNSLSQTLRQHGWHREPIKGIIITHGHLDHILNAFSIAKNSGAWIAAPRLDMAHYKGCYRYTGYSRVCGALESLGRSVLKYQAFHVDRWLDDLSEIPIWHGLTAIHLPGHTEGHMGFYSPKHRLLFSSDLFASYRGFSHLPPVIFNSRPELIASSVSRALSLDLIGVLPNHCDKARPSKHLMRLRRLHH